MAGFLSLPDELIELVGRQAIKTCSYAGLRQWCQMTSTCKRLWAMQLPGSAERWCVDLDDGMEGESKSTFAAAGNTSCLYLEPESVAVVSRCSLGDASRTTDACLVCHQIP